MFSSFDNFKEGVKAAARKAKQVALALTDLEMKVRSTSIDRPIFSPRIQVNVFPVQIIRIEFTSIYFAQVEEATSSETWGPHGQLLNDISDASFDAEGYRQIMGILAQRLQERGACT